MASVALSSVINFCRSGLSSSPELEEQWLSNFAGEVVEGLGRLQQITLPAWKDDILVVLVRSSRRPGCEIEHNFGFVVPADERTAYERFSPGEEVAFSGQLPEEAPFGVKPISLLHGRLRPFRR